MIYLQLFWVYIKIGLFGFGGGYAMLSLIQHEVVEEHGWISSLEFADIVAISQMTPGPIGINTATYIGYTVTGNIWGSILATFAVCLPSFIILLIIAHTYTKFRRNQYVEDAFKGIRAATVGLIAAAALLLITPENFNDYDMISILLFAIAFIAVRYLKVNPILMIIIAGIAGLFLY
jgi:Chromate transport protein ChrA